MPKPWEKYAQAAPAASGPWAKYGGGGAPAGEFRAVPVAEPERPVEPDRFVDRLPSAGPYSRAIAVAAEDAIRAAGHHAMKPLHGAAQAIEHGVGYLAEQLLPEDVARAVRDTVAADDAALRRNEAEYQAQVPDSVAAN